MNVARELIRVANLILSSSNMTKSEKAQQVLRRRKKVDALRNLANNIIKLRRRVNKDLGSDNEKTKLTALVITIMDKTAERVGNEESAENGHFGVTGFKKKHISVSGNKINLKYVGKSGVDHDKSFSDEKIAKILSKYLDGIGPDDYVFVTKDGFKIKADRVNRYLDELDVNAKDIRGYAANRFVVDALKRTENLSDEKDREKRFREIVKSVAERVGHGPQTLRKHYLLPNLENDYVKRGRILNIKEAGLEKVE